MIDDNIRYFYIVIVISKAFGKISAGGELTSGDFAVVLCLPRSQPKPHDGRSELSTTDLHRPMVSVDGDVAKKPFSGSGKATPGFSASSVGLGGGSLTIRSIAFVSQ